MLLQQTALQSSIHAAVLATLAPTIGKPAQSVGFLGCTPQLFVFDVVRGIGSRTLPSRALEEPDRRSTFQLTPNPFK